MKWWISGFFTLLIVLLTLIAWREEKSSGACYEQYASQDMENSASLVGQEQKSPQQADSPASNSESYLCRLIAPANLPTDYLVIVGIGGVFVALFTLTSIQKSADAAEKAANVAEKQLKLVSADVQIDATSLVPAGGITPNSYIAVRLKNFGQTRAEKVKSYIKTIIPSVPDSEFSPETITMAAGATQIVRFRKFQDFLNQTTFDQISNGTISVKLSGTVTYIDVFGETHILEMKEGTLDPQRGVFNLGLDLKRTEELQNPD